MGCSCSAPGIPWPSSVVTTANSKGSPVPLACCIPIPGTWSFTSLCIWSFRAQPLNTLRTVSAAHFLWLVLQHGLPKGLRRSRNFGLFHPNLQAPPKPGAAAPRAQARRDGAQPHGSAASIERTPQAAASLLRVSDADRASARHAPGSQGWRDRTARCSTRGASSLSRQRNGTTERQHAPRAWRQGSSKKPPFAPSRPCNEGGRDNKRRLRQSRCATRPSASANLAKDVSCDGTRRHAGLVQQPDQIAASRDLSLFVELSLELPFSQRIDTHVRPANKFPWLIRIKKLEINCL